MIERLEESRRRQMLLKAHLFDIALEFLKADGQCLKEIGY